MFALLGETRVLDSGTVPSSSIVHVLSIHGGLAVGGLLASKVSSLAAMVQHHLQALAARTISFDVMAPSTVADESSAAIVIVYPLHRMQFVKNHIAATLWDVVSQLGPEAISSDPWR